MPYDFSRIISFVVINETEVSYIYTYIYIYFLVSYISLFVTVLLDLPSDYVALLVEWNTNNIKASHVQNSDP